MKFYYHPYGDYAKNFLDGDLSIYNGPHTYLEHGPGKFDCQPPSGSPIYSMTDGTVVAVGWRDPNGTDGQKGVFVVVKTDRSDGTTNGENSDGTVFINYLELSGLGTVISESLGCVSGPLKFSELTSSIPYTSYTNIEISMGDIIGYSNNWYNGSGIHIDFTYGNRYQSGGSIYTPDGASSDPNIVPHITPEQMSSHGIVNLTNDGKQPQSKDLSGAMVNYRFGSNNYPPISDGSNKYSILPTSSRNAELSNSIIYQMPIHITASDNISSSSGRYTGLNQEYKNESEGTILPIIDMPQRSVQNSTHTNIALCSYGFLNCYWATGSSLGIHSPQGVTQTWINNGCQLLAEDCRIATIDGNLLIATVKYYGNDGDLIRFELSDGSFINVIKCDQKSSGDSNATKYGAVNSGILKIIEWQMSGTLVNKNSGYAWTKDENEKKYFNVAKYLPDATIKRAINFGPYPGLVWVSDEERKQLGVKGKELMAGDF